MAFDDDGGVMRCISSNVLDLEAELFFSRVGLFELN